MSQSSEAPEGGFTFVDKRHQHAEPVEEISSKTVGEGPTTKTERSRVKDNPRTGSAQTPDLTALFLMLAQSAHLHLGDATDPSARDIPQDLDQARYLIDLLALLQEKTNGNRSQKESELLEGLLYDLRLRFVEKAKAQ